MKIGFIGLGNMAKAIIEGILLKEIVSVSDIMGSELLSTAREQAKAKYGIDVTEDNKKVAAAADILFLAVKPQFLGQVIEEISESIHDNTIVLSIAAGKTIAFMEQAFGKQVKLVRCMPNTPALVLEGCTGFCINDNITEEDKKHVLQLLQSFGKASIVEEHLMDVVVAVSGSSPAYVFLLIEAMADGAVAGGMSRQLAYEFAAQAVLGSAKMVLETGKHPAQLKDMVCSPGGTTIEAIKVLEEMGFRASIMDAMEACVEKSKSL